ncbi:MAG: hypothetical protein BJ554DRAFT_8055, partial [Olpidium bornovanus]
LHGVHGHLKNKTFEFIGIDNQPHANATRAHTRTRAHSVVNDLPPSPCANKFPGLVSGYVEARQTPGQKKRLSAHSETFWNARQPGMMYEALEAKRDQVVRVAVEPEDDGPVARGWVDARRPAGAGGAARRRSGAVTTSAAAARRPRLVANMASARTLLRPLLSAGLAARESATVALAAVAEPAGCTSFCRASRQSARYSTSYGKLPCAAPSAALAAALTKPGLLLRGGVPPAPGLHRERPPRNPHQPSGAAEAHAHAAHFAVTKGSFARLRLRLKIMLMKQIRPWTVDDFMAMFSWVFVANGLYIVLGTTSFVSIVLWVVNSLQFQEFVARRLGDYLTRETGVTVTFESAIVPNWKDGKISLRNVCFSRQRSLPAEGEAASQGLPKDDYMYYDLTVEQIDVTLDLMRWLDGILRDARIKGVRGTLDRSHLVYDPNAPTWPKRKAQPGDLQLESFTLEDLLVTILQVGNFRPYTISIFNADAPHGLRIQWLLYDL